ncbi:MAG TPA: iron ABC transporter permease [Candidatus Eisenbacteria bacterium]|nr:iron ABC transporter permease [Candidatus Eisenbacteria bacterium]
MVGREAVLALRDIAWRAPFKRVNWGPVVLALTSAVVLYLVLVPLVVALVATFREHGYLPFEPGPLTFRNYAYVFLDATTWTLMVNTGLFAAGSLVLGMAFAILFGWLVERSDMPLRNLTFALVIAPMIIPGMMVAIAWIFLLDPRIGLINLMLRWIPGWETDRGPLDIYTLGGMIFVEGFRMVPTMFLMISAAFRNMDPSLEEASRVAGKSGLATVSRITLPLMRPAMLAALLYFFIRAIEVFEVPGVLGLNAGIHVFSTRIYWSVHPAAGGLPDYGLASTFSLILVAVSAFSVWLYYRLTRKTYVTVTGKGFRPQRVRLGRMKYLAGLLFLAYFAVTLVLPFFVLLWTSLHKFYLPPSWEGLRSMTLASYGELLKDPGVILAAFNTILLALLTGTMTMLIALFVGWFVVRSRYRLTRALDLFAFLPHALPTVVIALAVMLLYLSFPNPIYGTIVAISIALTTSYIAYGSRVMIAGFHQIHPELEEASRVSGANFFRTFWRVLLPLSAPAFINGWIWVAVHAGRELTAALMLFSPSSVVVSTKVWALWEQGRVSVASALGVVLMMMLILISWAGRSAMTRMRAF